MAFTANGVQTIQFEELEEFKKLNPEYSFLVPKDKENYYNEKLLSKYKNLSFQFEVEQITENKQRIKLIFDGVMSSGTDIYEATNKEVFPKPSAVILSSISLLGGAIACLIFFFIYRKYLAV